MLKILLPLILLFVGCTSNSVHKIPERKVEQLNETANQIIPKAKLCFKDEYEDKEFIIRIVDVYFDIFGDGEVLVTKIESKSELAKDFKKCIQRTYESFKFLDILVEDGKKIQFKQTLEFKSLLK
jgi:hypothetical protein